jgi:hypothetical protein
MIMTPDDHRSLQAMDAELAACEPHLAAMFTIFTRLNADEAPPPPEDSIVATPPAAMRAEGAQRRRRGAGLGRSRPRPRTARTARARLAARRSDGGWRPTAVIAIPVLLLVTVIVVLFFGLASAVKCNPGTTSSRTASARTALVVPGGASLAACQQSTGAAKSAGG